MDTKRESFEDRRERLRHQTFMMMFRILIVFGIPAVSAYFLGDFLDQRYDMRPYGSMIAIALALTVSWVITVRMYRHITQAFKQLDKDEDESKGLNNTKQH